ncbi:MAG: hypothetical protein V1846_03605 [Candidatus Komeilibacteria bacterium]
MKLNFEIDPQYDIQMFFQLLRQEHWASRVPGSGVPLDLAKQIHEATTEEELGRLYSQLESIAMEEYEKNRAAIEKAKEGYKESWEPIIDEFSQTAEELTASWYFQEYTCVITQLCKGLSNWHGNKIARSWKEDLTEQRRITAHELLLAHFFSIHRHKYPDSGLTDEQIWKLAEISSFALTGLEPRLKKFWPEDKTGYYTDHNYPELVELQEKLKEPFLNRSNFDEYIRTGINLVKEQEATEHVRQGIRPITEAGLR